MTALPDALEYYLAEYEKAHADLAIDGAAVMGENQRLPGFVAYYDAMHSDLDAILGLVERSERIARAEVMRDYANNPPTNVKLNTTELKALIECEPKVVEANELVAEVKYVYKLFSGIMKGLERKGFSLSNISKLRAAGQEEIEI